MHQIWYKSDIIGETHKNCKSLEKQMAYFLQLSPLCGVIAIDLQKGVLKLQDQNLITVHLKCTQQEKKDLQKY